MYAERVLSGMRPTGRLHLGHYHGVLANWIKLQHEFPCLFFVADWHALTTAYDEPGTITENAYEMVIDWLAAGVDPMQATIFIQSKVPEHAELHLLLSMMMPLGWLECVPTYKDQQEKLSHKDLTTYGFLGYPLLMSSDILIYRADKVPVGEDQVPHIEFTRELARRFNHLYGQEAGFEDKAREAVKKLGNKRAKLYDELRTRYQEQGEDEALAEAHALLNEAQSLSLGDRERLFGWLEGARKMILVEPDALLTASARMPGLDGQKVSKSYGNTIALREDAESVIRKIRTMQTDPQRVRRTDAGNPAMISRAHFARYIVEQGYVKDTKTVFDYWLAKDKPGYVSHAWATLADSVAWIVGAGGTAVIAHPGRYRLTQAQRRSLFTEFRESGGLGIEVLSGSQGHDEARELAGVCREFGFLASRGSDFHGPGESWVDLGKLPALPPDLTPVWAAWI